MTGSIPPCRDLLSREFQRILLVKPSSLGDVVHALPVLHSLRRRYPRAKIDWLIGSAFAPLLENNPDLNECILFDRRKLSRLGLSIGSTREFMHLVADLRRRRYDLVIDLQGLFRSGFLTWVCGAPVRLGFAEAREGAAFFYTHKIPPSPTNTHAVDRNLRSGEWLNLESSPAIFDFGLDEPLRANAGAVLRLHGVEEQDRFLAVAPGARWETKLWPQSNFVQTIDAIVENSELRCLLLGGPEDAPLCNQIAGRCRNRTISLAGKTSIRQLIAILERASVVLCHDSAPMHIAAALNRPLVCLTGPTNPARTGPYRRLDDVLHLQLPCSPCYLRKLSQCGYEHRCMKDLRVEDVVARVRSLAAIRTRAAGAQAPPGDSEIETKSTLKSVRANPSPLAERTRGE